MSESRYQPYVLMDETLMSGTVMSGYFGGAWVYIFRLLLSAPRGLVKALIHQYCYETNKDAVKKGFKSRIFYCNISSVP